MTALLECIRCDPMVTPMRENCLARDYNVVCAYKGLALFVKAVLYSKLTRTADVYVKQYAEKAKEGRGV